MCGITGIMRFKRSADEVEIKRMCSAMAHRGPDGEGVLLHEGVALGHRRLSIIDLEGGRQPLCTADRKKWIVFNGEIYNYRELRVQLEKRGYRFQSHSDTEVLLYAYAEWGKECLGKLRGMFAFAILDIDRGELFLARDPFGIKPLLMYKDDSCLGFASELGSLKAITGFDKTINPDAIDQFLGMKYVSGPSTAYKAVEKLLPAHYILFGLDGQLKSKGRYWQFGFKMDTAYKSEVEWIEEGDMVLRESVQAHLVADVPFGAFLSGGVDSSLVVSYMAGLMNQPVQTFTIGFGSQAFDERPYARMVAHQWQTDHTELVVEMDALQLLPELVRHYGEPFGDISAMPTWYVSQLARQKVPMVLSGDAGDELFAGYEEYTRRWAQSIEKVPYHLQPWKKQLYKLLHQVVPQRYPYRKNDFESWYKMTDGGLHFLWKEDVKQKLEVQYIGFLRSTFEEALDFSHFQKAQYTDFHHYLPDDVLTKTDIASMYHGLEVRTPLLDIKVVEWASNIPEAVNIKRTGALYEGKQVLKQLLQKYFPASFTNRKKQGFTVPLDHWLDASHEQGKAVRDRLLEPHGPLYSYFKHDAVNMVVKKGRKEDIWKLLFLDEWLRQNHIS